ncbi:serine/threonine protein kinase [Streptomonospora sp. PA3]|uniref:serine/threonine-protein kinase n=1 Tax=Streptomonospora sp. PA3 TaxID=2607326 RepID=UPI0012DC465F|nr:serine/threonine-protein kinase [Streptomonospora sp. PA3]MUL40105.1 serine/threonine protein kinase [Streptomonospora sp. PA3]
MATSPPPQPPPSDDAHATARPHSRGHTGPSALPAGFTPLEPGDPASVGPFRLVGRIGSGGMGAVYGALDDSGRHIALKVIHPRHAQDPAYRANFAREAELLARVDAECAPGFLGADTSAPLPWLATEFVQGDTLSRHTAHRGPLDGTALTAFAAGTAEALATVHAAGIVHRDIKPANVILGTGGPRVIDFGIARALDDTGPEEGVYGTPGWVAPERLGGAAATAAADVFAWGALVVHAATGHGPFGSGDVETLLRRTREGRFDVDGVPEDLLPLVLRALSADPAERPSATEAFEEVLRLPAARSLAARAEAVGAGSGARDRLRALLGAVWRGFGTTGRGAGPWVAAAAVLTASAAAAGGGSAAAGGAAAGSAAGASAAGGAGAAGAAGAGAAGAGTVAGMSKGVAMAAAGATAAAVVGGGWVAGRVLTDQPLLPGAQAEASPSPTASPSPSEPAYPQQVEFRSMTVGFPADWNVQRVQDDFAYLPDDPSMPGEWVAVFPGGGSCDTELTWTTVSTEGCEHIKILGPQGIDRGGPGLAPVDEQTYYIPSTDVPPCPEGVELAPFDRTQAESGPTDDIPTAPIGGLDAYYNEFAVPCYNLETNAFDTTYTQRLWLLPDSGILVVDNVGVPELGDMLARAQTGG